MRIHVQAETLDTGLLGTGTGTGTGAGTGLAYFEGQTAPVSIHTAERHLCLTGMLPILFNGNTAIDVGRTQRLHSVRQRAALTAQWNGCAWDECDKPAQFVEAHHIDAFNGTNTTLTNGITLCRFHHMQLHANGWTIHARKDGTHWLTPPAHNSLAQQPTQMHSKSPLHNTG